MVPAPPAPPLLHPEPFDIEQVTERLATTGFACVTDLFPDDLLDDLEREVRRHDASHELTPAGIGRGDDFAVARRVRDDRTRWIEGGTPVEDRFLAALETLRQEVNRRLMLGIFEVEAHYAVYQPGAYYQRHLDSFRGARNRLLTLVLYLNRGWTPADGGELLIYPEANAAPAIAAVRPVRGQAVIFLSETVPHEVAVTNRTRYSIAAWYRCRPSR
jgi:SM-20-related protein